MIPGIETLACGPLAVPMDVMAHVVQVESSRNPFAIGVVDGRLLRQPRSLAEAVATVRMLEDRGYNYSIGLAQVNRVNFERFGLETPEAGFDACNNLAVGAKILAECLQRHDGRWGDAFSCYYSGNPHTGYEHGYVQKVFATMSADGPGVATDVAVGEAIPLAASEAAPAVQSPWDAVYAARTSAMATRHAEVADRAEPLGSDLSTETGFVQSGVVPAESFAETSEPDAQKGARQPSAVPSSPEARFMDEMRQRAEELVDPVRSATMLPQVDVNSVAAENSVVLGGASETEAALMPPSITQQESNSRREDDARVF